MKGTGGNICWKNVVQYARMKARILDSREKLKEETFLARQVAGDYGSEVRVSQGFDR
jgi:hypothetical protein